jgi:pimeloyl-ACP methyl ester carboxylesterase
MPASMMTLDGFSVPVSVAGPDRGFNVVLLGAAAHPLAAYEPLCTRLHVAATRTIVIGADPRLDHKSVVDILDTVNVPSGVIVGDRSGAEVAWEAAAARPERFTGLVVIDRGHPRVPDPHGVVRDPECPPVEINTTALVNSPATRAVAKASQRFVYSDFRLVQFNGRRNVEIATAQLAAEIVLRTSTW